MTNLRSCLFAIRFFRSHAVIISTWKNSFNRFPGRLQLPSGNTHTNVYPISSVTKGIKVTMKKNARFAFVSSLYTSNNTFPSRKISFSCSFYFLPQYLSLSQISFSCSFYFSSLGCNRSFEQYLCRVSTFHLRKNTISPRRSSTSSRSVSW